jgi:hypothetical protein
MDNSEHQPEKAEAFGRAAAQGRSFAKDIAELALFLELTEPGQRAAHLDAAVAEVSSERRIPATTLKRCASEARALIDHARETGATRQIQARADGSDWSLRNGVSAWLDEISLAVVLKQRALRLNRSRGGRPPSSSRTLRAVEELVAFARAGRPGADDELRSIRALIAEA